MSEHTVHRVRYRERQVLQAQDLADEQAYRLAMRRRHNIGGHSWGIVDGLKMFIRDNEIFVGPGMAVDGFGRELFVPEEVQLPQDRFDELDGDAIDVWLLYGREPVTGSTQAGPHEAPGQPNRWREVAMIRLSPARADVRPSDRDFSPYETPPDDPGREWPVYLGRILVNSSTYELDQLAERQYVTLVGETIMHPTKQAQLRIGSQTFAIELPDENGEPTARLSIDQTGDTIIHGPTTISQSDPLVIAEHDSEAGILPSIKFEPLTTPPAEAAPWRIYRTDVSQDNKTTHQLRLEIEHPADQGDPANYRLAIGCFEEYRSRFKSELAVTASGDLIIGGDLYIRGVLNEGPIQADPNDPRFSAMLLEAWESGITTAGRQVDTFYDNELSLEFIAEPPASVSPGDALNYQVTVTNITKIDRALTGIQIFETLIFPRLSFPETRLGEIDLAANETSNPISGAGQMVPDGLGEATLIVEAIAFDPSGRPIRGSITRKIFVNGLKFVFSTEPPASVSPGDTLNYQVTVTNRVDQSLTGIQIFETLVFPRSSFPGTKLGEIDLVANETSDPISGEGRTVPDELGEAILIVEAIAFDPSGQPIQGLIIRKISVKAPS